MMMMMMMLGTWNLPYYLAILMVRRCQNSKMLFSAAIDADIALEILQEIWNGKSETHKRQILIFTATVVGSKTQ